MIVRFPVRVVRRPIARRGSSCRSRLRLRGVVFLLLRRGVDLLLLIILLILLHQLLLLLLLLRYRCTVNLRDRRCCCCRTVYLLLLRSGTIHIHWCRSLLTDTPCCTVVVAVAVERCTFSNHSGRTFDLPSQSTDFTNLSHSFTFAAVPVITHVTGCFDRSICTHRTQFYLTKQFHVFAAFADNSTFVTLGRDDNSRLAFRHDRIDVVTTATHATSVCCCCPYTLAP